MPKFKPYDLNQSKMIPLSYADQIVEGSFEHALNEIVEQHLDLSIFDKRYANDDTGRPAYDPKILLKVVLYGYYKGIISSRRLEEACRRTSYSWRSLRIRGPTSQHSPPSSVSSSARL